MECKNFLSCYNVKRHWFLSLLLPFFLFFFFCWSFFFFFCAKSRGAPSPEESEHLIQAGELLTAGFTPSQTRLSFPVRMCRHVAWKTCRLHHSFIAQRQDSPRVYYQCAALITQLILGVHANATVYWVKFPVPESVCQHVVSLETCPHHESLTAAISY